MKKLLLPLLTLCLLCACGVPEGTPPPETATTPAAEPVNAPLYRQLALYIRQGLVDYKLPGQYTLSFGAVDELGSCVVAVEGGAGVAGVGHYRVSWDEGADWYSFLSMSEAFLTMPDSEGLQTEACANLKRSALWSLEVDTQAPPEALPQFDTPPVPVETVTDHTNPDEDRSEFHRETYHYTDRRRGLDLMMDYPQKGWDQGRDTEGAEQAVDRLLRQVAVEETLGACGLGGDTRLNENGSVEVTYVITRCDERVLSVRFYTYCAFRWAAHPSWWERGVTLDRETGARLDLWDVLDFDGDGAALLRRYDWTSTWGELSSDRLAGEFRDWAENGYQEQFYLTEDKLGLIVSFSRYYTLLETELDNLPLKLEL